MQQRRLVQRRTEALTVRAPLQIAVAALCVLGSCYGQLAVALAARRQNGILKRMRATPLPAWTYFIGLLAHCVLVSLADIALIVGT